MKTYKGFYLKDGRFIRLGGSSCNSGVYYYSDAYINEYIGDDIFPDLWNTGDVQYFANGAKIVCENSASPRSANTLPNMTLALYDKNGGLLGRVTTEYCYSSGIYNDSFWTLAIAPELNFATGEDFFAGATRYFGVTACEQGNSGNINVIYTENSGNSIPTIANNYISNIYTYAYNITNIFRHTDMVQPPVNAIYERGGYSGFRNASDNIFGYRTADYTVFMKFLRGVVVDVKSVGEDLGETSNIGGQDGTYTDSTDIIPVPTLPTLTAVSCGLVKMYEITIAQATALANFMWSAPNEFSENLKKLFSNPMDAIITLHLTQVSPSTDGSTNIIIGGINTGVSGLVLSSQYVTLDCGTIHIDKYWGNSLDFSPYTKASIFLPMIGCQNLSIDDIMGKDINVSYNIDLLSGSLVCFIKINNSVMYTFQGNCISKVPITGADALQIYGSVVGAIANVGASAISGGSIGLLGGAVSSGLSVMGSKERVDKGGSISATAGLLSVKYPVITLERAVQSLPQNFKHYKGYTSNITSTIGSLSGYTEIEYIDLNGINATKTEIDMLENLLQTGFYA